MSNPRPPFYHQKGQGIFHWELDCSKNKYSEKDPRWIKTNSKPRMSPCSECMEIKRKR